MNKKVLLLFIIISMICFSDSFANYNFKKEVNLSNPAKVIVVESKSPIFKIVLASNPTTGYSWQLQDYDKKIITLIKHAYIPPKMVVPGAGGYEAWRFKVKLNNFNKQQTTYLKMLYKRPWEKRAVKELKFSILIKPKR